MKEKLSMVTHACYPSYVGSINKRIIVQDDLGVNARAYSKNS
jgi:hypothetical protein